MNRRFWWEMWDACRDRFLTRKGWACFTPWAVLTALAAPRIATDIFFFIVDAVLAIILVSIYLGFKIGELKVSKSGLSLTSEAVADGKPGNAPPADVSEENGNGTAKAE